MAADIIPTNFEKATIRLMLTRDDVKIELAPQRLGDDKWSGKDTAGNTFTCDNDHDYGHINMTLNGKTIANFDKSFAEMEYADCQKLVNEIYTKFTELQKREAERASKTQSLTQGLTPEQIQQLRSQGLVQG